MNHLGIIINQRLDDDDDDDPRKKKCHFIGNVNKMCSYFANVHSVVLTTLFKQYCCGCYGCTLWKLYITCVQMIYVKAGTKLLGRSGNYHLLLIHVFL